MYVVCTLGHGRPALHLGRRQGPRQSDQARHQLPGGSKPSSPTTMPSCWPIRITLRMTSVFSSFGLSAALRVLVVVHCEPGPQKPFDSSRRAQQPDSERGQYARAGGNHEEGIRFHKGQAKALCPAAQAVNYHPGVDCATLEKTSNISRPSSRSPRSDADQLVSPRLRNYRGPPAMTGGHLDPVLHDRTLNLWVSLEARFARIYLTRSQLAGAFYCVMLQPAMSAS